MIFKNIDKCYFNILENNKILKFDKQNLRFNFIEYAEKFNI